MNAMLARSWLLVCFAGATFAGEGAEPPVADERQTELRELAEQLAPIADPARAAAEGEPRADDNRPAWVQEYLENPLAEQETVTLDDFVQALQDPATRDEVIEQHWQRLRKATPEQQAEFLRQALQNDSPRVRRQAAKALQELGMLEQVVAELLLELAEADDAQLRATAVIGLENIELGPGDLPAEYWQAILEALGSDDDRVRRAAESRLESMGPRAVPALLDLVQGHPDPALRRRAAAILTRIVGSRKAHPSGAVGPPPADRTEGLAAPAQPDLALPGAEQAPAMPPPSGPLPLPGEVAPPPKSAAVTRAGPTTQRVAEPAQPQEVRVYFGTNRNVLPPQERSLRPLAQYGLLFVGSVVAIRLAWRRAPSASRATANSRHGSALLLTLVAIGVALWSASSFNSAVREYYSVTSGIQFGPHRNGESKVYLGYCDVSLPPGHKVGAVETPRFGLEDESEHVVLKRTELLEDEAFYSAVRAELDRQAIDSRDCFVFIHGYNVTFETAARRTAQIHYDLEFRGAPLFYSWPSRGSFRHYASDRNEIDYSRRYLKQFLCDIAERLDADRVHVLAHSMGADALSRAIRDMGDKGQIFDQVILAAPDIDADVFRDEVAPQLMASSRRTTLYCSRNDWALHASYAFNDSPRAGDSSRGVIVLKGLDTVDASEIDTDLLGHSYYGDCLPLLHDVEMLLEHNSPPDQRNLRPWFVVRELAYWTFQF